MEIDNPLRKREDRTANEEQDWFKGDKEGVIDLSSGGTNSFG